MTTTKKATQPNDANSQLKSQRTEYTFRTMEDLDALIAKANQRVGSAESRMQNDYECLLTYIRQELSLERMAQRFWLLGFVKNAINFLLKRK